MNDTETKQQFMLHRAGGRSYEAIAHELGVSKKTLIKWGREYREEIRNLEAIGLDALRERYRLTAHAQVKRYGEQLNRVVEQLAQRDLSDVPTAKLYDVLIKLDTRLQDVCSVPIINDETEIATRKAHREWESSLGNGNGAARNPRGGSASNREGRTTAADLVALQLDTLRRYKAEEIDERAAAKEMTLINSLFKGIEVAELQQRLERIEVLLRVSN